MSHLLRSFSLLCSWRNARDEVKRRALCASLRGLWHSWQGVALFAAGFCPAILILANSWFAEPSPAPHPFSSSLPGWTQTWLYYTSYRGFRGLEGHSFTLLFNQALYFLFGIPDYFL